MVRLRGVSWWFGAVSIFRRISAEPFGITCPQYIVLMILWEDAPCTVSHIVEISLTEAGQALRAQAAYLARKRYSALRPSSVTLACGAALKISSSEAQG